MDLLRHHIKNPATPGRRHAASLLRQEGQRIRLIEQSQLAVGHLRRRRVEEHPTLQQGPMEVGHQAADVARTIVAAQLATSQPLHIAAVPFRPARRGCLVHAVVVALLRHP